MWKCCMHPSMAVSSTSYMQACKMRLWSLSAIAATPMLSKKLTKMTPCRAFGGPGLGSRGMSAPLMVARGWPVSHALVPAKTQVPAFSHSFFFFDAPLGSGRHTLLACHCCVCSWPLSWTPGAALPALAVTAVLTRLLLRLLLRLLGSIGFVTSLLGVRDLPSWRPETGLAEASLGASLAMVSCNRTMLERALRGIFEDRVGPHCLGDPPGDGLTVDLWARCGACASWP